MMSQLEIIHLRASGEPIEALAEGIRDSLKNSGADGTTLTLYRRRGLETDLAIHIQADPSEVGAAHENALKLAAALRSYGLVEHTRWETLP